MILEALYNLFATLIMNIISLLNLSEVFPSSLDSAVQYVFNLINNNLALLDFFLPINVLRVCLTIVIPVIVFYEEYRLTM